MTTTSRLDVEPTAVSGNESETGATVTGESAWPDIEIVKLSLSMPIVVLDEWAPIEAGWNSYVNWQPAPGSSGTPAQFCEPPKLVASFGAPPAKFGVWVVALTFVTVTVRSVVSPTNVSANASVVGATVKSPDAAVTGPAVDVANPAQPISPDPNRRMTPLRRFTIDMPQIIRKAAHASGLIPRGNAVPAPAIERCYAETTITDDEAPRSLDR